ncbi:MAG: hypothetical protein Q8L74_06145 [Nitrospirota bacterium]|nr:hypothetical protein [Nitrospirota bacterium]
MRKKLSLVLYLLFVDLVAYALVVCPVSAFQLSSSTTGYVRVASQAAMSTMLTAQRATTLASVAPLISGASAGSVAVRLVASSVGWPALGLVAGMTLAMVYYDQTKVAAIKSAAAGPGPISVPGYDGSPITAVLACPGNLGCGVGMDQIITTSGTANCGQGWPWGTLPSGWQNLGVLGTQTCTAPGVWTLSAGHTASVTSTKAVVGPSVPATPAQVQTYVGGLPSTNPLSLESNTTSVGAQVTPIPADATVSNPIPETGLATTVVPAANVQPTDTVINPNATAPTGTVTTKTDTQPTSGTKTTTSTTTTNPDGSVTTTSTETGEDTAPVSCTAGNHDQRSFGSILQDHMTLWQGSGLLSAVNLLKTLTWPTTIPTYSLQSNLFGTFTLDFSAWSGMLTALRSIIIAIAGFVAYRIVFVGAR